MSNLLIVRMRRRVLTSLVAIDNIEEYDGMGEVWPEFGCWETVRYAHHSGADSANRTAEDRIISRNLLIRREHHLHTRSMGARVSRQACLPTLPGKTH